MVEPRMARTSPIVKVDKEVVGRKVVNPQGESLGKVEEVMLDSAPGGSTTAVDLRGEFGLGDKLFAGPWNSCPFDPQSEAFLLNDKRFLENAPGFDKENRPDMTNSTWRANLYSYYKATPYWEWFSAVRKKSLFDVRGRKKHPFGPFQFHLKGTRVSPCSRSETCVLKFDTSSPLSV